MTEETTSASKPSNSVMSCPINCCRRKRSPSPLQEKLTEDVAHLKSEVDVANKANDVTKTPYTSRTYRAIAIALLMAIILTVTLTLHNHPALRHALVGKPTKTVAFIGNSILYFYDLPRSTAIVSEGTIQQNSVFAGAGSLAGMSERENGMWNRWRCESAVIEELCDSYDDSDDCDAYDNGSFIDSTIWDFGACSMEMMLFGHDIDEAQAFHDDWWDYRDACGLEDDDGWTSGSSSNNDPRMTNPCAQSQTYLNYLADLPDSDIRTNPPASWDYMLMDDKTAGPRNKNSRATAIQGLNDTFLPLIEQSQATPVFMVTSAYWLKRDNNDDDGNTNTNTMENVPYWTAETYEGYRQYAEFLQQNLPKSQTPKLVNMGIAYLVVYEEDFELWKYRLFWTDNKHPSPHGSFLQTCLLHSAIYGYPPRKSFVLRDDMESLWDGTRTLMYPRDNVVPFPTKTEATYLYDVCERVARGYVPPTFIDQMDELGLSMYKG